MRALLILNPISGDKEPNTDKLDVIRSQLARSAFNLDVATTSPGQDASQLATDAVADGVQTVLVGGGDGTVSEVARALVHTPATLGVLPIGTFNNIARSLGIVPDLEAACRVIADGRRREIDVGLANEKRIFFEAAGAGLDATLFPIGEEIKGGRWTRVLQAARLTFQYQVQPFHISFDRTVHDALITVQRSRSREELSRRSIRCRALLVVAANGPYYGGGFTVAPAAKLSDGRLTVSIYRQFSKWELIRHFRSISHGRHHYSPKIETYAAAEVRLDAPQPISVHVDGQPFGKTPVKLRALSKALRVFAPERPERSDRDAPVALPAEAVNEEQPAHA